MQFWYRFCRLLFRIYFRIYHRGRVLHAERVPAEGAVILAGNHVSFLDPPFFGQAPDRVIYYLARDTLFHSKLGGWILRSWNCVPINRDRGDIGAMRTILKLLAEGKAVQMFPEGTRSKDGQLQEARAGIGMIIVRSRAKVLPMRIFGTDRAMPRGKSVPRPAQVTIAFGEPYAPALPGKLDDLPAEELKNLYREIGREIMRRIAALEPR